MDVDNQYQDVVKRKLHQIFPSAIFDNNVNYHDQLESWITQSEIDFDIFRITKFYIQIICKFMAHYIIIKKMDFLQNNG